VRTSSTSTRSDGAVPARFREGLVKILLHPPRTGAGEWRAALAAALPEAAIGLWPEGPSEPDYALVWKPPAEMFARVRPTKAIFNLGAGVEALLAAPMLPVGVPVIRLEDAGMAEQMAEYVTLAALRVYREADAYAAQQRARRWQPRPRIPKSAFGVGILGFGLLGRAVAGALAPFGFPLRGWSRARKRLPGVESFAGRGELEPFLAASQLLVCLLPSTPDTRGLLDRGALDALPRGAHVVNIARGDILVDDDLLAALDGGQVAGATLDVFRDEPLPDGHPFWHHPRITLTPHVSAVTLVGDSVAQVAGKIRRLERGEPVTGVVDRARGY
jgi:glyoxylate/hydroxypyruvate reductase A